MFWPEQIPIGLYTHINFAFATIDSKTFKVGPSSRSDVSLYKRIMLLKQKDPDLRVFIAIGGWTFNDPGQPTATTFSDLAASVPRQKAFIESLLSFMSTYGFDGVDLDWEYPAADDRNGRDVDFGNFPKFMSRLKTSLDSASKGISITLPAILLVSATLRPQTFGESSQLVQYHVSHPRLNAITLLISRFRSYDLHGTWDKGNQWTGNFLYGHTNLTEIKEALDLLWRNDIDPGQVVMGLGFYGRSLSATSQSCLAPGCTFESGGQKGKCSRETGILLNSEIDDLMNKNNAKAIHYKKEAVKVATWGDQWVSYDDVDTFAQNSEFAQTLCLVDSWSGLSATIRKTQSITRHLRRLQIEKSHRCRPQMDLTNLLHSLTLRILNVNGLTVARTALLAG
jgi:chitinase